MKITLEDLKASYRQMSEGELLALHRGELTDMARQCYDSEMERRGLGAVTEAEQAAAAGVDEFDEPLVVVQNAVSSDEAWAIVSQLERAGMPARVGGDNVRAGNWPRTEEIGRYPVAVPASRAEEAHDFLNAESPDAITVEARWEDGAFKPLEEIELPEGTMVQIHVPAEAFGAGES